MDVDGDGHRDILSGSYSRTGGGSMAGLFQVLYGQAGGTFRKAEVLTGTDDEPLIIPADDDKQLTDKICTRPFAVDWDADGHLDLVVGNFSGTFFLFRGEGKGRFGPKPEPVLSGGKPLQCPGAHADPFVVDWDGDGDLDILSGSSSGGVWWAENRAGKGKPPEMAAFRQLVPAAERLPEGKPVREADLAGPTRSTRVWAADVDADGKLDLLVGDSITLVSPAKGVGDEEFGTRHAAWRTEFEAALKEYQKAADGTDAKARQKASAEYRKVYDRRTEFMAEEMTGFVWLYRRK